MIYFWIILILILAFLCLILLAPLKVRIHYLDKTTVVRVSCLFIRYTYRKKDKKKEEQAATDTPKPGVIERIKSVKKGYEEIKDVIDEVVRFSHDHVEIRDIYIRVKYGTGDAAITGIIYGAIWSFVGNVYSTLCRFWKVQFPRLELEPIFGGKAFEIEAEGIIKTRLVHIITTAIRSLKIYKNSKKQKGENK